MSIRYAEIMTGCRASALFVLAVAFVLPCIIHAQKTIPKMKMGKDKEVVKLNISLADHRMERNRRIELKLIIDNNSSSVIDLSFMSHDFLAGLMLPLWIHEDTGLNNQKILHQTK